MKGNLVVKNGIYNVVISYKDEAGNYKKKWVSTGLKEKNNKRAAQDAMREIVAKFNDQQLVKTSNSSFENENRNSPYFADYILDWLEMARPNLQLTSYAAYLTHVKEISEYFRDKKIRLKDLKPVDIVNYYQHILVNGGSISKCEHHHVNIHRALQMAYRMDLIPTNPADKVDRPRSPKYTPKYYDYKKLIKFFEAIQNDRFELQYYIAALTGLRRSEICGIKWSAVNFDKNIIHINHSVITTCVNGKTVIICKDIMKNKTSRRSLPMIPILKRKFLEEKQKQTDRKELYKGYYEDKYLDYTFVDELGHLCNPDTLSAHFKLLQKKFDLPSIRFHDLRHSFASLLLACGASLKEVSEWLGHSTITITADLYGHLDYTSKLTVANTVAKIFGYDSIHSEDQSPYEIIRGIFEKETPPPQTVKLKTVEKVSSQSINDEKNISNGLPDKNSAADYKQAKKEMARLGFNNFDDYFDYLVFMQEKEQRKRNFEM